MARILPHYSLCPLIEQKSFLGLMKDVDDDTAIVTINANIIGRYKISDPKLLSSWNSKGSITSACIYDAGNDRYIAIFNEHEVRVWTAADENIDKLKKYKFIEKLYKLLICPKTEKVILVYRNGNVFYLDSVLENRKNCLRQQLNASEDRILSCDAYFLKTIMVVFVIEEKNCTYRVLSLSPDKEEPIFSTPFERPENSELRGHCLVVDKNSHLFTLWSNGKLYRDLLHPDNGVVIQNHFTTLGYIDLNENVVMKTLSPYYIAICGAKTDGVLLTIYSTKYDLIQCQRYYEHCQMLLHLWNFESKLFLIIGHNLVVAPYVQENRKLSTLIGSNVHQSYSQTNSEILPEAEICTNVVPILLEKNDADGITSIFESHYDIPDSVLIDILFWSLQNASRREGIIDKILCNYIISDGRKLRSIFDVDLTLGFLDYVMTKLNSCNTNLKMIKWASLFIDAFYSQLIMSNDVVIVKKLKSYIDVLEKECKYLNNYKQLMTVMSCVKRKKVILI